MFLIKTSGHKSLRLSGKALKLEAKMKDLGTRKFEIRKLKKNIKDK